MRSGEKNMRLVQSLRAWCDRPVSIDQQRAWIDAERAHSKDVGGHIAATTLTGLIAFAAIGPPAFWWTIAASAMLLAILPLIEGTTAAFKFKPHTHGALAVHAGYSLLLHGLWASLALALWFMAPADYRAFGMLMAMAFAVHIALDQHQRPAILIASILPPIVTLLIMGVHAGHADGTWAWLVGAIAMIGALGAVIASLAKASSRQRSAERAAHDNLARWELASRASKAGMWEYDFAEQKLVWSDSMQAMLAAPPAMHDTIGKDFAAMASPEWRERVNTSYRAACDAGETTWMMEYPVVRGDGVEIWIENSLSIQRDAQGELVRLIGFVQDVTERRAEERAALNANRAKTAFLAAMSHEIRTPMNAVLGMTELLGRENLSIRARDHVATLRQSGRLLMTILDDLLDLSKIEAGKMDLETTAFTLADVLDQAERLWRPRAEEKGLRLRVTAASVLTRPLLGDPARLQQILFNLLSNAVKFTSDGEVTLTCSVDFDAPGGAAISIRVADTGIGLTHDQRQRLFTPYVQADETMSRRFGGTGLGLAISQKLAEAMSGAIQVISAPGIGSIFTVTLTLPLAPIDAGRISVDDDDAAIIDTPQHLTILLAEDHLVNQQIVRAYLAPLGHEVVVANDGVEAVEFARLRAFDLILMDVNMPRMSGLDATRAIRASVGPNTTTPIIGVTADAFEDQKRNGFQSGMTDYVAKPIAPQALLSAIATAVATRSAAAAHPQPISLTG